MRQSTRLPSIQVCCCPSHKCASIHPVVHFGLLSRPSVPSSPAPPARALAVFARVTGSPPVRHRRRWLGASRRIASPPSSFRDASLSFVCYPPVRSTRPIPGSTAARARRISFFFFRHGCRRRDRGLSPPVHPRDADIASRLELQPPPRGLKRSRSPEDYQKSARPAPTGDDGTLCV